MTMFDSTLGEEVAADTATPVTDHAYLTVVRIRAADVALYAGAALWATDEDRREFLESQAARKFDELAEAMGCVVITQAEIDALTSFVENVRDLDPTIISGRDPGDRSDVPDMMPLDEFRALQEEAEALMPKAVKVTG